MRSLICHGHHRSPTRSSRSGCAGFSQPASHLEAEGDRSPWMALGATNHHRVLVGPGQLTQARQSPTVKFKAPGPDRGLQCRARPVSSTWSWSCRVDVAGRVPRTCSLTLVRKHHVVAPSASITQSAQALKVPWLDLRQRFSGNPPSSHWAGTAASSSPSNRSGIWPAPPDPGQSQGRK